MNISPTDERFVVVTRRKARDETSTEAGRFEDLICDLSRRFAGIPADKIDGNVDRALKEILAFTGADHCALFQVVPETGQVVLASLAGAAKSVLAGTIAGLATLPPWLYDRTVNRMQTLQTGSGLFIPYPVNGMARYLLVVLAGSGKRDWPEGFVERLRVLGTVLVSALNTKTMQRFSQATLDALNEYVGVIDVAGTIVETSGQWGNLGGGTIGAPEAVPVGGNYLLACESMGGAEGEWAARLARGIRSVLAGDADRFAMESARQLPDGLRWMHTKVRRFAVDAATYAAISHEDITYRRTSEQELQDLRAHHWHSERITRTGVLVGSLAHELSQPLTAVLSNAQAGLRFLASDSLATQEIREILGAIVSDSKRAGEIIESLRIMLVRQKAERQLVDVADIALDVITLLHTECIRQQVEVEQECTRGCVVLGDRGQLQQVVLNLMMNGIDAMASVAAVQRRLRVTVMPGDPGEVCIGVRDCGVGITQRELEKAFGAFWTTKSRGMGMGLAICHSIVQSHGGRLRVERNHKAGSTFFVTLPAAQAHLGDPGRK